MKKISKFKNIINKIRKYESIYENMSHDEILNEVNNLKQEKNLEKILPQAFALCVIASSRILNMRHFDVQLIGGIALHKGLIAEMKTGEGKTLVATCPAFLNALTGKNIHIITVNDYLAKRDSEQMGKVFEYLGLTTGCIYSGMPFEKRQEAYKCNITYGTNSEFGFDYLRDNMAQDKSLTVQQGLNYVIIDEIDSVLIDDAGTPLIISGGTKDQSNIFEMVDKAVKTLKPTTNYNPNQTKMEQVLEGTFTPNGDYILLKKTSEIILTDSGISKIESLLNTNLSDENNIISHFVNQSLRANYIMQKDVDYIIKDNKIVIVDNSTGRLMETRKYADGLHQAIEAKEGVAISEENRTLATITYQNFFRMYGKLSGMTGTAFTDKYEFKTIYNLNVMQIPTNKPVIRIDDEDLLYRTKKEKYEKLIEIVNECIKKSQPVLIGTQSIEESEFISNTFNKLNIKHNLLNAKTHEREAEIIAQAGKKGAITIATNMAGRGTDILLGGNYDAEMKKLKTKLMYEEITEEEFNELSKNLSEKIKKDKEDVINNGGLFVIGLGRFFNRRIDDQLKGRSGRQGDPGHSIFLLSLEDELFKNFSTAMNNTKLNFEYTSSVNNRFIRNTQKVIENLNYSIRKNTLSYDDVNNSQRQQIYNIRTQVLNMNDNELFELFEKYKNEIVHYLLKTDINLNTFFNTQDVVAKDYEYIKTYIDNKITESTNNLKTHDETIYQMLRYIMIKAIDSYWVDYINKIISLKETVNVTTMGSLKPIQLYKIEAIKMFNVLIDDIKIDIVRSATNIKIKPKLNIKISL